MLHYCTTCRGVLGCQCVVPKDGVAPCPATGAIWVHVLDERGEPAPLPVTLTPSKGLAINKPAAPNGFAQFPDLDPGAYRAHVDLNSMQRKSWKPVTAEASRQLAGGQLAYLDLHFARVGAIKATVKLAAGGDPIELKADVSVKGGDARPLAGGSCEIDDVPVGVRTASISGDADYVKNPLVEIEVRQGETTPVVFQAKPRLKASVGAQEGLTPKPGWWHPTVAEKHVRVPLVIRLAESLCGESVESYKGKITLKCTGVQFFGSKDGGEPIVGIPAGQARGDGKKIWAMCQDKPTADFDVKLELDKIDDHYIVEELVACKIKVGEIDIVTPVLPKKVLVLKHNGKTDDTATTLTPFTLKFKESVPGKAKELKVKVKLTAATDGGGAIDVRKKGTDPLAATLTLDDVPAESMVEVKGRTAGKCKLTLALEGVFEGIELAPHEASAVWVEELEIKVHQHEKHKHPGGPTTTWVAEREVFQHHAEPLVIGAGAATLYPRAQVRIKKPTDTFWEYTSKVVLTPGVGGSEVVDTGGTKKQDLIKADFTEGYLKLEVKTVNSGIRTPKQQWDTVQGKEDDTATALVAANNFDPKCRRESIAIACGATANAEAGDTVLVNGSRVVLKAFSFDQDLDRRVWSACKMALTAAGFSTNMKKPINKNDVAIAIAASHHHLGLRSGIRKNKVNKTEVSKGFEAFAGKPNTDEKISFINARYGDDVGVASGLHASTEAAIRHLLDAGGWDAVAHRTCGIPGLHAEIIAVNDLLLARHPVTEITVSTYQLINLALRGMRFPTCRNCNVILKHIGVRAISQWTPGTCHKDGAALPPGLGEP